VRTAQVFAKTISISLALSAPIEHFLSDQGDKFCNDSADTRVFSGQFYYGEYAYFQEDKAGKTFNLSLKGLDNSERIEFYRRGRQQIENEEQILRLELRGQIMSSEMRFRRPVLVVCELKYL
jgi:hypothetical protein